MKPTRRPRLCVERLEQRECPVASVSLAAGSLFVRGAVTPHSTTGLQLMLTKTATPSSKSPSP
jgi:hypothetical protein